MKQQALKDRAVFSWRPALWAAILAALLVPLIAMQVTDEVNWTAYDFAVAAILLIGMGLAFELLARTRLARPLRIMLGITVAAVVALVWADGAVGVF